MSIKLQLPKLTDLTPRLTVIGVGGAGCNAINNMIAAGLTGVEFVVANTDAQSLAASSAEHRIQLGINLTEGLGAGSRPEIGEAAAEEAIEDIRAQVTGSHMVFIAAGMGGGTGTGAASVLARVAREQGILTVGVVTKPFQFEGARRMRIADAGISELRKNVDTLIVIPNQNLFRIANEKTTFAEAFVLADQVLYSGVACIVDLILKEGLINLDFADVRTVMSGMGTAMMGTGEASGDRRAILAAEEAISNPLLDDVSLKGAKGLLLSITGGRDLTLYEVDEAASRVRQEVDSEANIIVGATFDESLGDRVRVSIVASGMMRAGDPVALPGTTASRPQPEPVAVMPAPVASPTPAVAAPVVAPAPPAAPASVAPAQAEIHHAPYQPPYAGNAAVRPEHREPEGHAYDGAPAFAQPAAAPAHGYTPPPPRVDEAFDGAAYQPPQQRETWRAPGNVVIEEGLPNLGNGGQPVAARAPMQAEPAHAPAAHADFTPAAPSEIRRPVARRMPEVEDFPVVGQRDYRAKTEGRAAGNDTPPPLPHGTGSEPRRKAGFFERLTGRSGRHDDESNHVQQASQAARSQGRQAPPLPTTRGAATGSSERTVPRAEAGSEGSELPVFFNRDRK